MRRETAHLNGDRGGISRILPRKVNSELMTDRSLNVESETHN